MSWRLKVCHVTRGKVVEVVFAMLIFKSYLFTLLALRYLTGTKWTISRLLLGPMSVLGGYPLLNSLVVINNGGTWLVSAAHKKHGTLKGNKGTPSRHRCPPLRFVLWGLGLSLAWWLPFYNPLPIPPLSPSLISTQSNPTQPDWGSVTLSVSLGKTASSLVTCYHQCVRERNRGRRERRE